MPHAALFVVQPCMVGGTPSLRLVSMPHAAIPFRPHHRFAVPLPRSRRGGFSFTARQLLSPMRGTRTAAKYRRSVKDYGILASPADAGERSTSANHTSFYSCSWDVFPYDLFPVQLCPMGLLLRQVSKWRAQRADRGAHAARGFVGCAAAIARTWTLRKLVCFNAARGFVGGAASSLAALVPLGEKALLESLRKFESSDGKYVKYPFLFSFSLRRKPLRDQHLARP